MSSYRVRHETVELGELDLRVRVLHDKQEYGDDNGEAARLGITSANWSIFGVLWPSSKILAQRMITQDVEGKRILEVGCGLALASLVLAGRGADITATDYHPEVEPFLLENCALNDVGEIGFFRTNWEDDGEDESLGQFDLIVASDIMYERAMMPQLVAFMNRHAASSCELIVVDPRRENRGKFSRLMGDTGWTCTRTDVVPKPPLDESYRGQVLHFVKG